MRLCPMESEQRPVTTPGSSNGRIAGSEPADSGSSPLPGMDWLEEDECFGLELGCICDVCNWERGF